MTVQAAYDLTSPAFLADPHPTYAMMREESPIYPLVSADEQTVFNAGTAWYVTRYDDARSVLRDHQRCVRNFRLAVPAEQLAGNVELPEVMDVFDRNLLSQEPPEHERLRSLVGQAFTPRRVEAMADRIEEIVTALIDRVEARKQMDLIEDFALPLPLTVITELLGLPRSDHERIRGMTVTHPPRDADEIPGTVETLNAIFDYLRPQFSSRRAAPEDDLVTGLLEAEIEGDQLDETTLVSMVMTVLTAGYETTVNLIGNGMLALLRHPDQLHLLRSDPRLIQPAVEEFLRFDGPLETALPRWAAEDFELHGHHICRGDRIIVGLAAADRDPRRFQNPDRLDVTRRPNPHLGFGFGIHYCLGAPLARMEGRAAIRALLARLPGLRLGTDVDELEWRQTPPIRGLKHLPLVWD